MESSPAPAPAAGRAPAKPVVLERLPEGLARPITPNPPLKKLPPLNKAVAEAPAPASSPRSVVEG